MEAAGVSAPAPKRSVGRWLAGLFHGRPRLQAGALLAAPMGWLVIGYLGSLTVLLISAFWSLGELSGQVEGTTLEHLDRIYTEDVYRAISLRTIGVAAAVTVTDALLAVPIALYMAKFARPRLKSVMVVAVLIPLWSAYLVKAYAWRTILSESGPLNWALDPLGLDGPGYGLFSVYLVMSYIWLPYMIIPVYAGLERIPDSLLSASADLGGRPGYTLRRVVMPLAFPALVAGSIFTFSLTLGDFITPDLVGGSTQFIGTVVYDNFASNLPLAAAFTTVPIIVMTIYLLIARRLGAFDHL